MNRLSTVNRGDIIHSSDDTLINVHHIGKNGEVFFLAYADNARGRMQSKPYYCYYGYISECYPATEEQKKWLENWILAKKGGNEK